MLEGREYDAWSDFITSIGKDTARLLLNARGYRNVSDIDPARRKSVMKGMACDVRDGFRHQPFRFRPLA